MIKRISLHPYIAAFFELAAGLILFWTLLNISSLSAVGIWFAIRVGVTLVLVALVYYPAPLNRYSLLASLLFAQVGFSLTLLILDQKNITEVAGIGAVLLSVAVYALLPATVPELSFAFKPARRARLMLAMIGIFGLWSTLFALSTLQLLTYLQFVGLWIAVLGVTVTVAVWWWREYAVAATSRLWLSATAFFLLLVETSGFLWWWPIGYLAAAFLMMWWWYVAWLLIRFHLTEEGVVWKKQLPFLIFNALTMCAYIFLVVRWK